MLTKSVKRIWSNQLEEVKHDTGSSVSNPSTQQWDNIEMMNGIPAFKTLQPRHEGL